MRPNQKRFLTLAAASLVASGILLGRVAFTGTRVYTFLAWNLVLAWVPYLLSLLCVRQSRRWLRWLLALGWLGFFPNAPYLITDILHFRYQIEFGWWYDAGLLFAFIWTGVVLGITSLRLMHDHVTATRGRAVGLAFVTAVALLSGFGVFLGRFLRWNTWDLLRHPLSIGRDLKHLASQSLFYPQTLGFTLLYATILLLCYATDRSRTT